MKGSGRLWLGSFALLMSACVPTVHSIDPYRSDPGKARVLERRAEGACADRREAVGAHGPASLPKRPFATDGCSAWPDSEATRPCCVEHDIAYWCGGSAEDRLRADDAFRECVSRRSGSDALGAWMRFGVRVGGHPFFPMPYRWGYGDAYQGGYPSEP